MKPLLQQEKKTKEYSMLHTMYTVSFHSFKKKVYYNKKK